MRKDEYYAITKHDKILKADTWEELLEKTPLRKEVKIYIAFRYDEPYITAQGTWYYWPQIQILNRRRMQKYYRKGMLKVNHVEVEGSYYLKCFRFDLENCFTQELFSVYKTNGDTSIKEPTINDFYNVLCDKLTEENEKIRQDSSL